MIHQIPKSTLIYLYKHDVMFPEMKARAVDAEFEYIKETSQKTDSDENKKEA